MKTYAVGTKDIAGREKKTRKTNPWQNGDGGSWKGRLFVCRELSCAQTSGNK